MKPLLLVALAFVHFTAAAAEKPSAAVTEPPPPGQRVATCGHSFHVWVVQMLADLAAKADIQGHEIAGVSSIGGSMVVQHWKVPDDKSQVKQALMVGKADVLTLSPIWLPDEGIEDFVRLGLEKNPNLRVFVQEFWLPNDEYNPVYPLDVRKKVEITTPPISRNCARPMTPIGATSKTTSARSTNARAGRPSSSCRWARRRSRCGRKSFKEKSAR